MAYTAFSSSRKSEQDQVWVGLAKEPPTSWYAYLFVNGLDRADEGEIQRRDDPLIGEMENDVKRLEIVADRFSKIGSTPKLEELKVYDVVKDFMDYFKIRVSKNITFELSGNPHLLAGINVPLFDWVLENLMKNAVNAIEGKGAIKVEVSGTR